MAATRRRPSMQIFQDPSPSSDHHEVASYEAQLLSAFGPVTDVSSGQHTLLEPPNSFENASSPRKTNRVSSSPPPSVLAEKGLNSISIPPPPNAHYGTDSLVKKAQKGSPRQSRAMAKTQAPIFASFSSGQFDKENMYSSLPPMPRGMPSSDLPQKLPAKRALGDSAPLRDRSNKKQKVKEELETGPIPEPHEMPSIEDDGTKPNYSYANLIGMAILRAPNRRLTLAQIYKWISDTFKYYRNQETGWQNSIRHNLSLSKAFEKQERPKDDPGKGHYWVIVPGCEKQFHKVRATRRMSKSEGFMQSFPSDITHQPTMSSMPLPSSVVRSMDSSKFPEETELSSDATIPCSDPAAHDGQEPGRSMPPPSRQIPSSPPPADIHSSPPAPISRSVREDTPPRAPRLPSNSRSGGRKRKFAGLGDSGYYSSIESSAIKGNPLGPLLTSEADFERQPIKRGRAEEEIARIRGSSYDSPSKTRPYLKPTSARQPPSSPYRSLDPPGDPLTPAIIFKRPALPPASASPNTNLRNHRNRIRELIGSPDKSMAVMVDSHLLYQPWSPPPGWLDADNFNVQEPGFDTAFDVFADLESPTKRSAKRPRLERAATTTGILADITGVKVNSRQNTPRAAFQLKSPFLDMPTLESHAYVGSPIKAPTSNPLPAFTLSKPDSGIQAELDPPQTFDLPNDENLFVDLHSDESEETGFDILQGFQKIGAAVAPNGSPSKPASRPGLARSNTTRF